MDLQLSGRNSVSALELGAGSKRVGAWETWVRDTYVMSWLFPLSAEDKSNHEFNITMKVKACNHFDLTVIRAISLEHS